MDYNFQIWINHKYDKNLYRYNILDILYDRTLNYLNSLGLRVKDSDYFDKNFLYFVYYHSKRNTKLYITKTDDRKEAFDFQFEQELLNLCQELQDYLGSNGFYELLNSQHFIPNFIELIYNNVEFSLEEDLSDTDQSEEEYFLE